ncbi:MAG TPA: hydrogenase nickel incorporation protein HypB [Anaeromyxobacteraceae bacterium]|nr:hydrogenase nickel incorporation protein HypB [Anaeromyxobacteraceae bacterium]
MCTTCGCGDTELVPVELHEKILAGNDRTAAHNREHFREAGVLALNIMGSPGSGKTAVLEATARVMKGVRLAAVSADLATDNDARRLEKAGIPSKAITTGQACHLDAELVHRSLHGFPWSEMDVFFIENVGNLVCPAIYDLGQEANVVALSVTEGEDKPLKYPVMFQKADLVLVTKVDLVPHLDVDLGKIRDALSRVMPDPKVLEVSARTGQGMDAWKAWLESRREPILRHRKEPAMMHAHSHAHEHEHTHTHEHEHGGVKHSHPHSHKHAHSHEHGGSEEKHDHAKGDHGHDGSGHDHSH